MADEDQKHTTRSDEQYPDFAWSRKKRKFLGAYHESDGDIEIARKEAGYSERYDVQAIIDHPAAQAYLLSLVEFGLSLAREARTTIVGRYSEWASTDAGDFFTDGAVPQFKGLEELTPAQRRCIRSIKVSHNQFGDNVEIAFEDRMAANGHLARLLGLDKDAGTTPEAFARAVQEFMKLAFSADAIEAPPGALQDLPVGASETAVEREPIARSPALWGDSPSPLA